MTMKTREYHDEYEVYGGLHFMEPCDLSDDQCVKRHSDKALELYCDTHPSAPECRVYQD